MKDPGINLIRCGVAHCMILRENGELLVFGNVITNSLFYFLLEM